MRSHRLPVVLSSTALVVAVLGFTPLGEAAKNALAPRNSVGTAQLRTNAVTSIKIKNKQINQAKIRTGAVGAVELRTDSVTTAKIAPGAVTPAKFGAIPAAGVSNSANVAVPHATPTAIPFDNERFDIGEFHPGGSPRLVAPAGGTYIVTANIAWGLNPNGGRRLELRLNAGPTIASVFQNATSVAEIHQGVAKVVRLAAGDFVEVFAVQTSGGTVNVIQDGQFSPEFAIAWIGP